MTEKRSLANIFISYFLVMPLGLAVGLIFSYLFSSAAEFIFGDRLDSLIRPIGASIVIVTPIFIVRFYGKIYHFQENEEMFKKDRARTEKIINGLKNNLPVEEFFLYLRPFKTDGIPVNFLTPSQAGTYFNAPTLDDEMAEVLRESGALMISLGNDANWKVGSSRIATTDKDWEWVAGLLIESAAAIIILPFATKSLMHEIDIIRNNNKLKQKSLFIMPPHSYAPFMAHRWNLMKNSIKIYNDILPDYRENGAIFNLNGDIKEFKNNIDKYEMMIFALDILINQVKNYPNKTVDD